MKIIAQILFFIFCLGVDSFAQSSVLAQGKWLKVSVSKEGVYNLNSDFFKRSKVSTKSINPQNVRVFTGQMDVLPQKNSDSRIFDLEELRVFSNDTDQKLDSNDDILFYAGSIHQKYYDITCKCIKQKTNPYSNLGYYFINISDEPAKKIIVEKTVITKTPIDFMLGFEYQEKELKNVLSSGRQWFGDFFYNNIDQTASLKNLHNVANIKFFAQVMGIGRSQQTLTINVNGEQISKLILPVSTYNPSDNYARYNRFSNLSEISLDYKPTNPNLKISYSLSTENSLNAGAYLDFLAITYPKILVVDGVSQEHYYYLKGQNQAFTVSNLSSNTKIWNLENSYHPLEISLNAINNKSVFELSTNKEISSILIFDTKKCPSPTFVGEVINQNVKTNLSPELLVIYPLKFKNEIEPFLIHKRKNMGVEALGVPIEEIYNEFSSGKVDPTAIRDVIRYFWNKDKSKLKYVLLVGDASFDYKNNNNISYVDIETLIPTYESLESLEPIYSYSSDDYFGFLEDAEGDWPEGKSFNNFWVSNYQNDHSLDVAIGRLPVKSQLETRNVVKKIIDYELNTIQEWKNKLTFVADNKDFNIHQRDADKLSELADINFGGFEISKIFLDDFVAENISNNPTVPSATKALTEKVNEGSFIVNYNGHGSEEGWAQEKLLTIGNILNWQNTDKLPIFFTATCQFGKFDNPNLVSGAELSLLNPKGGAIALLTTTRPVYSSTNERINSAFYNNISKASTLGDLFKITKNQSIEGEINRNFSLLGDPSLKIPNFNNKLIINLINDKNPEGSILNILEKVNIKGSSKIKEGVVYYKILDKPLNKKTLGNFPDSPAFSYQKTDNVLIQGKFKIIDNKFEGNFQLPRNILNGDGNSKMIFYATNSDSTLNDYGFFSNFIINNKVSTQITDILPPKIAFQGLNSQNLIFTISDESGMNLSATDSAFAMKIILNDSIVIIASKYYKADFDYKKGQLTYNVGTLPNGLQKVRIIVYDSYNNRADQSFLFDNIKPKLSIINHYNYPNPLINYTSIDIFHNREGDQLETKLYIYDLLGRQVSEYSQYCNNCPAKIDFGLDFEAKNVLGNPIIYKIQLKSLIDNSETHVSGKMLFWK